MLRREGLLLGALDGVFEVLASVPIVIEYEAVLTRPEHLRASGLSSKDVNEVLDSRHLADAAYDFGVRVARPLDVWKEIRSNEKK